MYGLYNWSKPWDGLVTRWLESSGFWGPNTPLMDFLETFWGDDSASNGLRVSLGASRALIHHQSCAAHCTFLLSAHVLYEVASCRAFCGKFAIGYGQLCSMGASQSMCICNTVSLRIIKGGVVRFSLHMFAGLNNTLVKLSMHKVVTIILNPQIDAHLLRLVTLLMNPMADDIEIHVQ